MRISNGLLIDRLDFSERTTLGYLGSIAIIDRWHGGHGSQIALGVERHLALCSSNLDIPEPRRHASSGRNPVLTANRTKSWNCFRDESAERSWIGREGA